MAPIVEKFNLVETSTPPSHCFFAEDPTSTEKSASGELYHCAFRRASQSDIQVSSYHVSPSAATARPARVLQICNFDFFTISHFRADSGIFFLTQEGPVIIDLYGGPFQLRGSIEDAWTVSTWQEFTSSPDRGAEVRSLIGPMLAGIASGRSEALIALAREAARQKPQREEEDFEEWAARLAEDSANEID